MNILNLSPEEAARALAESEWVMEHCVTGQDHVWAEWTPVALPKTYEGGAFVERECLECGGVEMTRQDTLK